MDKPGDEILAYAVKGELLPKFRKLSHGALKAVYRRHIFSIRPLKDGWAMWHHAPERHYPLGLGGWRRWPLQMDAIFRATGVYSSVELAQAAVLACVAEIKARESRERASRKRNVAPDKRTEEIIAQRALRMLLDLPPERALEVIEVAGDEIAKRWESEEAKRRQEADGSSATNVIPFPPRRK